MLIFLLSFLLISNALSLTKDKSILFSRIVMVFLSTTITGFSLAGIPLLIGFFAKQMVLSTALDNGYVFMALVAVLTSVMSAVYYLNVIKNIFFFKDNYQINPSLDNLNLVATCEKTLEHRETKVNFKIENIVLSRALSNVISILTLILLLFIYIKNE
jgi:NADH-ubiquinone oxidoreductase chain 2